MLRPMQGHSAPPATSTTHQLAAQPRKVRLSFRKRSTDVEKADQYDWRFATTAPPSTCAHDYALAFLASPPPQNEKRAILCEKGAYCELASSLSPHPLKEGVPTALQDANRAAPVRLYSPPDVHGWSGFGETRSYAQVRRGIVLCGGAFHDAAFTRVDGCDVVRLYDWELRMRKVARSFFPEEGVVRANSSCRVVSMSDCREQREARSTARPSPV